MTESALPERSDEERTAVFDELMRLEMLREEREPKPVNGLAVVILLVGVLGGFVALYSLLVAMIWGALALATGPFVFVQMKDRGQRGLACLVVGLAACATWMALFLV
ncbi:MAG: hypothetical protein M3422_11305, partial [Actinomycetota bacterium]|nr:hypothetical protein [Actinomycetota bacterium]